MYRKETAGPVIYFKARSNKTWLSRLQKNIATNTVMLFIFMVIIKVTANTIPAI